MRTRDLPTCPSAASVYTAVYMCHVFFFFWLGSCPLLYVRTSCVSRDPVSYIVSAYLVSYFLLVRQLQRFHNPTLETTSVLLVGCINKSNIISKRVHCCIHLSRVFFFWVGMRVVLFLVCIKNSTISSKNDDCCILVQVAYFFLGVEILPFFFSLFYVRTSCVSRHPVSYIVSACLVSYCLLVRQQQRFHHPTLRPTSVVLVGCIIKSNITSKHDHRCILVQVRKYPIL